MGGEETGSLKMIELCPLTEQKFRPPAAAVYDGPFKTTAGK